MLCVDFLKLRGSVFSKSGSQIDKSEVFAPAGIRGIRCQGASEISYGGGVILRRNFPIGLLRGLDRLSHIRLRRFRVTLWENVQ